MKRNSLILVALGASLLAGGYLLGQAPAKNTAPAAAAKPTKLVRVATLNGIQANREFQANVQLVQAQRQAVLEINAALDKEKDEKKKKELKAQQETILKKLNENNAAMQKAYGFTLTRNYTLEIETAHILMEVTEEEAAKLEKAEKDAAAAAAKKK